MLSELVCLALTVYYEARSEPVLGQVAVAEVVLNRQQSPAYPNTICEVVTQGGTRRDRCQFSYYCDGKPERPTDWKAWRRARVIAELTQSGVLSAGLKGVTHYHTTYVAPAWDQQMTQVTTIGRHRFYMGR